MPQSVHSSFKQLLDRFIASNHMERPKNFSFVTPTLAGMGFPQPKDSEFLVKEGITHVISMTEEAPSFIGCDGLKLHHFPVRDFTPPTLSQIKEIVRIIDVASKNGEKSVVHCAAGIGRTGTIIACYLAFSLRLSGEEAVLRTREKRPGSVETSEQFKIVGEYASSLKEDVES